MKNSYKRFSYFYDEVTSSLNYDLWLEFVEPYLNKGDSILDLACGTGTFCTMLKLQGYESEGLDLSESIIEIANEKKRINHLDIPFHVCDMTSFNLNKKFDVITCFFDSVNFLSNKTQINNMLNCVHKHLKDGGVFICDIFSTTMLEEYDGNELHEDYETFFIDWTTKKTSPKTLCHSIKIKDFDEVFEETYYEYYYDVKDLANKKFQLIKISGDFNDDYEDGDERILLVYKKL